MNISALTTENVMVPVAAPLGGVAYDPTGDAVEMAFLPRGTSPTAGDWHAGSWVKAGSTFYAICLVGPATGGVALPVGVYMVWVKINDLPEVVVRLVGTLTIT